MAGTIIECKKCGRRFTWSYGEQRYFEREGLDPPKHCRMCRSSNRYAGQEGMRGEGGPLALDGAPGWTRNPLTDPVPSVPDEASQPSAGPPRERRSLLERLFGWLKRK
jgi:hypothetical protein